MSFKFNWPEDFPDDFYEMTVAQIETALNKGKKPPHICDAILVSQLFLGTIAPSLEVLEISELGMNDLKFKGIFRFTYSGDAFLVLSTKVQVNPVTPQAPARRITGIVSTYAMVSAHKPLVVPMQIRICDFKLDAIFSLSFSASKGLSLSFKNDPINQICVQSTFDDVGSVRDMLQNEIEKQLRSVLNEELPRVLHEYSLRLFSQGEEETNDVSHRTVAESDERIGVPKSFDSGIVVGTGFSEESIPVPHIFKPAPVQLFTSHKLGLSATIPQGSQTAMSVRSMPVVKRNDMRRDRRNFNFASDDNVSQTRHVRKRNTSTASAPLTPFVGLHPSNLKNPASQSLTNLHIRTRTTK